MLARNSSLEAAVRCCASAKSSSPANSSSARSPDSVMAHRPEPSGCLRSQPAFTRSELAKRQSVSPRRRPRVLISDSYSERGTERSASSQMSLIGTYSPGVAFDARYSSAARARAARCNFASATCPPQALPSPSLRSGTPLPRPRSPRSRVATPESRLLRFSTSQISPETLDSGVLRRRVQAVADAVFRHAEISECGQKAGKTHSKWSDHTRNNWSESKKDCAPGGTRTPNPLLRTELLFH